MVLALTVSAFAADLTDIPNADTVEEDVAAAIEQADAQPIVADKGVNTRAVWGTYPTRKGVILSTPTILTAGSFVFVQLFTCKDVAA